MNNGPTPKNNGPVEACGFDPKRVYSLISSSSKRMTPADLEKRLAARRPQERRAVRQAVRELIDQGSLQYTSFLGCSFLEPSTQGIRRTGRTVLKPPLRLYRPGPNETVVVLSPGSAFGMGDHASTRLALKGIERAAVVNNGFQSWEKGRMLDIGTGCGVLMIAAVLMGMKSALGIDRDPCARYEAKENARINGVDKRVEVADQPVEALKGPYALVAANLRWPTLKRLAPRIGCLTDVGGSVVVSGVRKWERDALLDTYDRSPFSADWVESDQGWCGALFVRGTG